MSSLIEELQRDALTPSVRVSDLLRKAKTIAVKLNLSEFEQWIERELNGYPKECAVPEYRIVVGQVKGKNPFYGWRPVIFSNAEMEQALSRRPTGQKVAELENLIDNSDGNGIMILFDSQVKQMLMRATHFDVDFTLIAGINTAVGILDAVRNAVLDWALKLEKSGIRGDGMSFSVDDQKKAQDVQAVYNIGNIQNFTGNMGSGSGNFTVEGNTINADAKDAIQGLIQQIRANREQLGLGVTSVQELSQTLDGLQQELENAEPSSEHINGFLASIRKIAEGAAGSLAAQGILFAISKLAC
jgi:hypothetical protein